MGKNSDIIDNLMVSGRGNHEAYVQLLRADSRAFRPLVRALRNHPDEDIRESVAEILGERRDIRAIPYLIEATDDPDWSVRQDAQWSIETICEIERYSLSSLLDLDLEDEHPVENRAKIQEWWEVNRQFIENSEWL